LTNVHLAKPRPIYCGEFCSEKDNNNAKADIEDRLRKEFMNLFYFHAMITFIDLVIIDSPNYLLM